MRVLIKQKKIVFILFTVISGRNKCDVLNGRNQLQTIIDLHRTEQPATHFLCIPLDAEHMEEKFADFKEKVLELNVCIITLVGLIFARLNFATSRIFALFAKLKLAKTC